MNKKLLLLFLTLFSCIYADSLLTVVLMVKNEESVINKTLQPFVDGGVDSFFIFDTGSTDETIETVQQFFDDHNIEHAYIEQEPFVDFATSRNRALELAHQKFPDATFMIMPDAEWYIHNVSALLQFCAYHKYAQQKSYLIRLMNSNFDYYVPRLIRCNQGIQFTGAVHEVLNHLSRDKVPADVFFEWRGSIQGQDKSRSRWQRDKELLYNEYVKHPQDPRTLFYLAQTYECLGEVENAYTFYTKRTAVKGWDEENFVARYRLAGVMEQLPDKFDWSEVMDQYMGAFSYRPHRAEPLVKIAQHYYKEGNMPLCFLFAKQAAEFFYPTNDILFVEKYLYDFVRFDLLGIASWYVGEYEIGEWAMRQALKAYPNKIHLHKNFGFYSDHNQLEFENHVCEESETCPYLENEGIELVVIVTSYNNEKYYYRNLDSIINQQCYFTCEIIYINDCSTDKTGELVDRYVEENSLYNLITVIHNKERVGALANLYNTIHTLPDHKIVVTIDGDDFLAHDHALERIVQEYRNKKTWLAYSQMLYYPTGNSAGHVCEQIPQHIMQTNNFRQYKWVTYQVKSFYAELFKKIKKEDLMYEGEFIPMSWDIAMMFPMLEMASKGHISFIPDILYLYNFRNPLSDHNRDKSLQRKLRDLIRSKKKYDPLDVLNIHGIA